MIITTGQWRNLYVFGIFYETSLNPIFIPRSVRNNRPHPMQIYVIKEQREYSVSVKNNTHTSIRTLNHKKGTIANPKQQKKRSSKMAIIPRTFKKNPLIVLLFFGEQRRVKKRRIYKKINFNCPAMGNLLPKQPLYTELTIPIYKNVICWYFSVLSFHSRQKQNKTGHKNLIFKGNNISFLKHFSCNSQIHCLFLLKNIPLQ